MLDSFYDSVLYHVVTKGMDASDLRQKVIANNIANADTPHFKRVEVNFEDAFKQALEKSSPHRLVGFRTSEMHIPINMPVDFRGVKPVMWRQNDSFARGDDNDVDMDVEMADLAKNEIMMDSLVEVLNRKMKSLQLAMRKG